MIMQLENNYQLNVLGALGALGPAQHGYPPAERFRAEQTLLAERGCVVSSARFVVFGTTYPIAGLSSVRAMVCPVDRSGTIRLILVGAALLLLSSFSAVLGALGLLLVAFGLYRWSKARPVFGVRIATAGCEVDALWSQDRDFIDRVTAALNQGIIQRG
jgi:hypothetical protein